MPTFYALLARWQAAKHSLPLVKTSDSGFSMVVAPWGEVLAAADEGTETVLFAEVPVRKTVAHPKTSE